MRQVPNLRYTARGRPQSMQRRTIRVEYLGVRFAAAILDLLAMVFQCVLRFRSVLSSVVRPDSGLGCAATLRRPLPS
jgi:hypothetical protein